MKLSEMRELLSSHNIQLTKSLGQNFLYDSNQLTRIVDLAELTAEDCVLEIGPGLGPLTELLLQNAGKVLAIEKDRRLVDLLQRRFSGLANFELIAGDALAYLRNEPADWSGWKVVSNLPYSVGSPLLVELVQHVHRPALMVVTLQLEVVRRLLSNPGEPDYGLLTVLIRAWYQPDGWFRIPASCFFPQPEVDSGSIKLVRRTDLPLPGELAETFVAVAKRGFSQRRKMMFKLLKEIWPEELLRHGFKVAKLAEDTRAEMVSVEKFAKLAAVLRGSRS